MNQFAALWKSLARLCTVSCSSDRAETGSDEAKLKADTASVRASELLSVPVQLLQKVSKACIVSAVCMSELPSST